MAYQRRIYTQFGTFDLMAGELQEKQDAGACAPLAVVMISLNEAHNMDAVLENLSGFAQQIFLVDSYSIDATIDIALKHGIHVVQRRFRNFGDQWNFALAKLPITEPWTMKLDPDERLTDELKASIRAAIIAKQADGFTVIRRLWFMNRPLPVRQKILRVWKTGACRFSDVLVNEHPIVNGRTIEIDGDLEHYDSPHLHHWFDKQNHYTTAEALSSWRGDRLSALPRLFGNKLERRMWLKDRLHKSELGPTAVFLYNVFVLHVWRAGRVGMAWAHLRAEVTRWRLYKRKELDLLGRDYKVLQPNAGKPDPRVPQFE